MILVSSGTHLVKNHESLSQKKKSKIENAWAFMYPAINPQTDAKPLYYILLKLKYSPSIYLKHKKRLK